MTLGEDGREQRKSRPTFPPKHNVRDLMLPSILHLTFPHPPNSLGLGPPKGASLPRLDQCVEQHSIDSQGLFPALAFNCQWRWGFAAGTLSEPCRMPARPESCRRERLKTRPLSRATGATQGYMRFMLISFTPRHRGRIRAQPGASILAGWRSNIFRTAPAQFVKVRLANGVPR